MMAASVGIVSTARVGPRVPWAASASPRRAPHRVCASTPSSMRKKSAACFARMMRETPGCASTMSTPSPTITPAMSPWRPTIRRWSTPWVSPSAAATMAAATATSSRVRRAATTIIFSGSTLSIPITWLRRAIRGQQSPLMAAPPGRVGTTSRPDSSIMSPPTIAFPTGSTPGSRTVAPSPLPAAATTAPSVIAIGIRWAPTNAISIFPIRTIRALFTARVSVAGCHATTQPQANPPISRRSRSPPMASARRPPIITSSGSRRWPFRKWDPLRSTWVLKCCSPRPIRDTIGRPSVPISPAKSRVPNAATVKSPLRMPKPAATAPSGTSPPRRAMPVKYGSVPTVV